MKEYLTVEEVGEILKLGRNTVYKLVSRPDFPKIRIGRTFRIPKEEFDIYMTHYTYKEINI